MKKFFLIALMTLTLATATSMPAFAGMNNTISEDFSDDLPEIEVEESEDTPEIDTPEVEEPEAPEESEDSKEQDETEAPAEETEDNKSEESEPETKEEEVVESHEETKTAESEVPEKEVVIRNDNDNTPEKSSRTIYAHRSVVICDNEPIESLEEIPETEVETTAFEAPEEETTVVETETTPVKVPTSSSLPKTADFSDLMIAGVAVMVVLAAAFAVVANRRKRA